MQRTRTVVVTWSLVLVLLYWCHPSELITTSLSLLSSHILYQIFNLHSKKTKWNTRVTFYGSINYKLTLPNEFCRDLNLRNHIRLYQRPSSKVAYPSLMIKVIIYRLREAFRKKNRGYNEFGTISVWTPPPTINSEKSNSENWSQYRFPPSLKK